MGIYYLESQQEYGGVQKMCSMAFGVEVRQGQMYQVTEAESSRFGLGCYGMSFLLENQNMHQYSVAVGARQGLVEVEL